MQTKARKQLEHLARVGHPFLIPSLQVYDTRLHLSVEWASFFAQVEFEFQMLSPDEPGLVRIDLLA